MIDPPWRKSISVKRSPWKTPFIDDTSKPPSVSNSGEFGGVEFAGVERIEGSVRSRGEGDAVRRRHQQQPAGAQDPSALFDELQLVPKVLDDLEIDHHVDRTVWRGQRREVASAIFTRGYFARTCATVAAS